MWITPISFLAAQATIALPGENRLPLPPWSGVPIGLDIEVGPSTLNAALSGPAEGYFRALDESGATVECMAVVDRQVSHTCESDTVLVLVLLGPFSLLEADSTVPSEGESQ